MKKLPHEKLRDIDPYTGCVMIGGDEVVGLTQKEGDIIANEIEKYYIPRPRYEDGEPVQFGKEFVDCNGRNQTLSSLTYTKGGHGYVSLNGWTKQRIDEPTKRPEPDSLEKLRDDMAKFGEDTYFCSLGIEGSFDNFVDRLTAIMERDA